MSTVKKIARRSFLLGSAAVAGGVAFGVYAARKPFENPNLADLQPNEVSFNPWVIINDQSIKLIASHADKGQGVWTTQAALIAEELDVDLDQVEVSFGKPDKAYFNTAFADAAVPFMSIDLSATAETMRSVAGNALKLMLPMVGTGGSTTVPDTYVKLRHAGAVARETLKAAAAKKLGVSSDQLRTEKGQVIAPNGQSLAYTELATEAGKIAPIKHLNLRDPKEWKLIGKPIPRLDMVAKSTGAMPYSIDQRQEGMVYAAIKVNPRQGGGLKSYDASAAMKMPGVSKVLEITNGLAVIANNSWRAMKAAEAISYDWEAAPYPAEQAEHWQTLIDGFDEAKLNAEQRVVGSVDEALADGGFEAEYRMPYAAHAPLEPLSATVLVTDEEVQIWSGHQMPVVAQQMAASITGHSEDKVRLHNQFMGGSFGHRLEFDFIKQAAEIANQMRGTPVKMTYSREEDFAHDYPRHITMARGKGAVANGKIEAIDFQISATSVMGSQMGRMGMALPGPDTQLHEGAWDNPYFNLPNLRVKSYNAGPLAPVSSWRSVGAAPNGFAYDSFIDELIHEAGADPLEERIRLMGHDLSVKVLEAVGEMSSWGSPLGPNKGRGVAFVLSFGVPVAEVVEVTNTPEGIRVDKVWIACEVGRIIDPTNFDNLVKGGVVWGLGHAMNCEITYSDGMAQQTNYHAHEGMRLHQCPQIFVKGLENGEKVRGIGEPPVPPAAPALANAIFNATGQRLREMPFNKFIDFV